VPVEGVRSRNAIIWIRADEQLILEGMLKEEVADLGPNECVSAWSAIVLVGERAEETCVFVTLTSERGGSARGALARRLTIAVPKGVSGIQSHFYRTGGPVSTLCDRGERKATSRLEYDAVRGRSLSDLQ
jgi:hypothetical protein